MRYPEQERTLNHQQRIVIARRKPLATPYDMSAYIIVEIEITDPVGYEEYKKLAGPTVEQHGGNILCAAAPAKCWKAIGIQNAS
jgi:hypothetical protein